jgi:hypothetical protein
MGLGNRKVSASLKMLNGEILSDRPIYAVPPLTEGDEGL